MRSKKSKRPVSSVPVERIARLIHVVRGHRIMLDADLASLYGVATKRLNEQVRRNAERFPADFMFRLTEAEANALRSQIATSNKGRGGRRYRPSGFTEYGAIMAAMVLNSPRAVEMSVQVVRAFVRLRELLASNVALAHKLDELERRLAGHDHAIHDLFEAIRRLLAPPPVKRRPIGFHVRDDRGRYTAMPAPPSDVLHRAGA